MPINSKQIAMADKNMLHQVLYHDDNIAIELDLDKKIKYVNASGEKFFGVGKESLINVDILSYCKEKKLLYPKFLKKALISNEIFEQTSSKISNKSESFKLISWRVVPLYLKEKIEGYFLFGKDITQLKRNELSLKNIETRLHLFINSVPGYHWWKDLNGKYLGCNEAVAELLGLGSSQNVIGKTDYELAWSHNADLMTENDKLVIKNNEAHSGEEIVTGTDNTPHTFFVVKMPLKNDFSETIGTIGSSIDITERKIMEEELRQAKIKSEAANHAKTEFIANMSHDIRTPLSGVVGMSKALEEHTSDPEEKQYAHWVNECGQQLLNLLNEILDVISADNVNDSDLRLETFDLYQCIQDIAQLELPTIKLKKLDLNVNIQDDIPKYIVSDRTKLHRTILNLLGNSIKFTQQGSVGISVKLVKKMTDAVRLEFSISDTGIGIPDELQPNVFDRFFRVNPSSKGIYKGHGLGLHIAQSYVELLGGKIKLHSKVNQGTTFFFELTFKTGNPDNIHRDEPTLIATEMIAKSSISEAISMSPSITEAPHVLIIEDNHVALLMAEMALKSANCRYTSAKNADMAFQLVQSNRFDLIITDMGLPDMSGTELTQKIRKWEISAHLKAVPIIGLTAHTRQTETQKCLDAGMNRVLVKPVNSHIIQEVVNEFINNEHGNPGDDLNGVDVLDIPNALASIGNEDVLVELLEFMINTLPEDVDIIEDSFKSNDESKVRSQAHKIKSGALYVGTLRLKLACQYLEDTKNPEQANLFKPRYLQLLEVIRDTRQAISMWLDSR